MRQPSNRLKTAIGLLAIVLLASPVLAEAGVIADDFEDGTREGWSGGEVVQKSTEGQYGLRLRNTQTDNRDSIDPSGNWTLRTTYYPQPGNEFGIQSSDGNERINFEMLSDFNDNYRIVASTADNTYFSSNGNAPANATWHNVKLTRRSDTLYLRSWEVGNTEPDTWDKTLDISSVNFNGANWSVASPEGDGNSFYDAVIDSYEFKRGDIYSVSGTVKDNQNQNLQGVTITAENATSGNTVATTTTDSVGQYSIELSNGTYDITASKDGYLSDTETVTVQGQDISGVDFSLVELDSSITLRTRDFLEHGQTADYTVTIENNTGRYNVSEQADVTSKNTSVVTVDQSQLTITATNDTSINERTYIVANYTDSKGNNYTQRANVTVANKTVENIGILPTGARLGASIEDQTLQVIIVATMIGGGVALASRVFAGLAAQTFIMVLGWLGGMVGNGMVIVSFMMALFIGLNVATNIDYNVGSVR